jgi:hypothetical protein
MKLIPFPQSNIADIPTALRNLANDVENGKHGDAHNLAWVIDCGDSSINVGLMGKAGDGAPLCYYLLGLGMRKFDSISG